MAHYETHHPPYASGHHLKADIDVTSNGSPPDFPNKFFMDLSYRNYCKSIQDRAGYLEPPPPPPPQSHDYDEAIQSQSITTEQQPGSDYHGGDGAEKSISKYADLYIKNFDSGSALIRARQLDEMQNVVNCDSGGHSAGHDSLHGSSTQAGGGAAVAGNGGSNNGGGNTGSQGGTNDDSSEARNYASSDDMNQTTSSERDDKLGSGSEDEGKFWRNF